MTGHKVAINWHAPRDAEKIESLCSFFESNGLIVHRWDGDGDMKSLRVHVRVIVVCLYYLHLGQFHRQLDKAKECKTPLVFVWIGSEEPENGDNARVDFFDELIYDCDQLTFVGMVFDKIVAITSTIELEEEDYDLVEVKRQKRRKLIAIFITLITLSSIGLLLWYFLPHEG